MNGWTDEPGRTAAKAVLIEQQRRKQMTAKIREQFLAEEAPHLTRSELQRKAEWLFQLEEDDLFIRIGQEMGWTREMIGRLQKRPNAPDLSGEAVALKAIEQRASAREVSRTLALYFDLRR